MVTLTTGSATTTMRRAMDDLFAKAPAKRQRKWTGMEGVEPLERDIHAQCADALDKLLGPPAVWFTYPAGAVQLSPQQQARYSRVGLRRGLPDIWIIHYGCYCVELKRKGGRLSKTTIARTKRGSPRYLIGQEEMFPKLLQAGVKDIAICHSVTELLDQLARWQIPLRGRIAA